MPSDPRKLWQSQHEEPPATTLEEMRRRAEQLRSRTRRELLTTAGVLLTLALFGAFGPPHPYRALQIGVYVLCLVWALFGRSYALHRGLWGPSTIELYRRELEQRRKLFARALQSSLGPVLVAIAAFVAPLVWTTVRSRVSPLNMAPFFTLLAVWVVAYLVLRRRESRALDRELEEVKQLTSQR